MSGCARTTCQTVHMDHLISAAQGHCEEGRDNNYYHFLMKKLRFKKVKLAPSHVIKKWFQLQGEVCDHYAIFLQILSEKQKEYLK